MTTHGKSHWLDNGIEHSRKFRDERVPYPTTDSDSDSDNVYSTKIDTDTISGLQKT